jgi:hypothetical protein
MATSGGKDRFSTRSRLVVKSAHAVPNEAFGPFADMSFRQSDLLSGPDEALLVGQQQHRPRPFGQTHGRLLAAQPALQFLARLIIHPYDQRRFASAHGNLHVHPADKIDKPTVKALKNPYPSYGVLY